MAAECLRAIDGVTTPDTPVLLCGHSFGAIVAFEMAHQLRAAGRPLGLLAIIDMPLDAGRRRWWQHLRDILANLPAWLRYDAFETDWTTLAVRSWGKLALMGADAPAAGHEHAPPNLTFARISANGCSIEMEERLTAGSTRWAISSSSARGNDRALQGPCPGSSAEAIATWGGSASRQPSTCATCPATTIRVSPSRMSGAWPNFYRHAWAH